MQSAGCIRRTPSVTLRVPPPSMREARKYFGFTSWFLRVFRRVAGDVPLPLPVKRALHGSRKASASCLRKTGRRGRRPLPCAYCALHCCSPRHRGCIKKGRRTAETALRSRKARERRKRCASVGIPFRKSPAGRASVSAVRQPFSDLTV